MDSTMEAHVPMMLDEGQGPFPTGAFMSMSNGVETVEKNYPSATLPVTVPMLAATTPQPSLGEKANSITLFISIGHIVFLLHFFICHQWWLSSECIGYTTGMHQN